MSSSANAVVAMAQTWVGTRETGYNVVPGITDRFGINGQSWCLAWVEAVLADCGHPLPAGHPTTLRCDDLSRWAHRTGRTRPIEQAQIGDVIIFSWYPWRYEGQPPEPIIRGAAKYEGDPAGDHVGIVTTPLGADGCYGTIEGNTSRGLSGSQDDGDGVWERRRPVGAVCCVIPTTLTSHPAEAIAAKTPAAARMADYSWARPDLAALRAAGFSGVVRYVPGPGFAAHSGADIDAAELARLRAAGMSTALVWQTAGRGESIGWGEAAVAGARQIGYAPGAAIFTAVDYDATWPDVADLVMRFAGLVEQAGYTAGVYGGVRVIDELPPGLIGWQTVAWSGGRVSPKAHLLQHLPATVGGAEIDPNDVLRSFPVDVAGDGGLGAASIIGPEAGEEDMTPSEREWLVQVITDSLGNHRSWTLDAIEVMLERVAAPAGGLDEVGRLVRDIASTQVAMTEALSRIHARLVVLEETRQPGPDPARQRMHMVVESDTVRSIARTYGVAVAALVEANGLQPGVGLEVGQVLIIPATAREVAA